MTRIGILLLLSFLFLSGYSQQTIFNQSLEKKYREGLELFEKGKYGAAQHIFDEISQQNQYYQMSSNGRFYAALCGIELYNKDAEEMMLSFIRRYPEHPKVSMAHFQLGKFYYAQKRWKDATREFEKTELSAISNTLLAEYYFKLGYSWFQLNDLTKAAKALYEIKGTDNKYQTPALFYLGHIEYQNGHYETALQDFNKIRSAEGFSQVIPYYICQIYYLEGKYDSLTTYGPPLLQKANTQNAPEIAHMLGDACFKLNQFPEAITYLENFQKSATRLSPKDYYQLGFAYYKTKNFNAAANFFEKAGEGKDTLAQNALYLLADCYLNTERKLNARNAFYLSSSFSFDKDLQESASLNYAKLSSELGFQTDAINSFSNYLKNYPQSPHKDEINESLSNLYLQTRNYKEALEALENIGNKSEKIKAAYQHIAYYRGVELYSNQVYTEAASYLQNSLKYPVNPELAAKSTYWLGEISYRKRNYDEALQKYEDFLYKPAAANTDEFLNTDYNIGYVYFKKEDYNNALTWFRKYQKEPGADKKKSDDAGLRIADCYFVKKDYLNALEYFKKAIDNKVASSDYALFQKGMIEGIQNRLQDKINTMQQIIEEYAASPYADDAIFEEASTSQLMGENLQALNLFEDIVANYPSSTYLKKALLSIALLYYNERRDEKALEIYKEVITKYPNSPEAHEALTGIKNIYVNEGDSKGYLSYASSLPFSNISQTSQDSITYEASELRFMKEDCENAIKDFNNYLQEFPKGAFILNAHFYKAECEYKLKQVDKALEDYSFVVTQPSNPFTEKSLLKAAQINFLNKQYSIAFTQFHQLESASDYKVNILEAQIGALRSAFLTNDLVNAEQYADKIINNQKVSQDLLQEALLTKGLVLMSRDSLNAAYLVFEKAIKNTNNEKSAEAKYYTASILMKQSRLKDCEKALLELGNNFSSDYWIAKGYILLADNYLKQNDPFQAKATLQSVISNYEGQDLKDTAQQKLTEINSMEKAKKEAEAQAKEKNKPVSNEPVIDADPKNQE